MKRLRLKNIPKENIKVFGICSTEKIYKLCWMINQVLDFEFINVESHQVYYKDTCFEHLLYQYIDLENETRYYLVQNKTKYNTLSKQFKVVDYFLISISDSENIFFEKIQAVCKEINLVRAVVNIDYQTLKQKDRFYISE